MPVKNRIIRLLVFFAALSLRAEDIVYVKAARLILDASQPPIAPGALVITDGTVTAAGANVQPPAGARTIDLSAYTVLHSILDAHCHLWTGGFLETPSPAYAALKAAQAVGYALNSGVAALRVLGSGDFIDVAMRTAIEDGTIPGPHVIPAGHALTIPGGHGDRFALPYSVPLSDLYTPLHGFVSSPEDAERAVQLQVKYGAKVIKLAASGGVGSLLDSPGDAHLSLAEMRTAVEQAHMHHLKVAAHAENLRSIMEAMQAGVDSIEHGSELNQEAVDYAKTHAVTLVPTLNVVDTFQTFGERQHLPEVMMSKARNLAKSHFPSFQLALKNGVTMAAGSDTFYSPGGVTVLDELVTDVKYGMTPRQALEAGTIHGSSLLGLPKLGRLTTGMEGDLLAVEGDPLADIHALEKVRVVIFQGRVVADKRERR
jgi:imidazolonepropionase-like amidohydrolase